MDTLRNYFYYNHFSNLKDVDKTFYIFYDAVTNTIYGIDQNNCVIKNVITKTENLPPSQNNNVNLRTT